MAASGRAPAYLQFALIISISAIKMFYIAKEEPFTSRRFNYFVFSMELIYFLLGGSIFVFTDATGVVNLKQVIAIFCIFLLSIFFLAQLIVSSYFATKGKENLKLSEKKRKQFRKDEVLRRQREKEKREARRKRKKVRERTQIEE